MTRGSSARSLATRAGRVLGAAVVALAMAGCASGPPTMRADVARFHGWQADAPLSFAFRTQPAQAASLEHRSYEQRVRERLIALGFTEAPTGAARYQVVVDYGALPESRRVTEFWPPLGAWGAYGWGPGPWIGPRPGLPYGRYDPWWGLPPTPIAHDTTVVRHDLRVDLFDVRVEPAPGRKVWESRASAHAQSEAMPRLMPGLVDAVFTEFPGESGATRRVQVPLPDTATKR